MSTGPLKRVVKIANPHGFHMRPQSLFAQRAKEFGSNVVLCRGEQRVNGKNPWDLMLLAAEEGTELVLEVDGPDADQAVEVLAEILEAPSAESIEPVSGD